MSCAPAMSPHSNPHFRADIEGLRAIAILLVIGAHYAIPGLSAGFIGVDIFFVISGYLITGILVREYEKTASINLARFYANRFRRLLPALAVVLIISCYAAFHILPQDLNLPNSISAAAASGWVSNIYFTFADRNYFDAGTQNNLFLHTWSLGVEEQFYLFWPLLLLTLTTAAKREQKAENRILLHWHIGHYFSDGLHDNRPSAACDCVLHDALACMAVRIRRSGMARAAPSHALKPANLFCPMGWHCVTARVDGFHSSPSNLSQLTDPAANSRRWCVAHCRGKPAPASDAPRHFACQPNHAGNRRHLLLMVFVALASADPGRKHGSNQREFDQYGSSHQYLADISPFVAQIHRNARAFWPFVARARISSACIVFDLYRAVELTIHSLAYWPAQSAGSVRRITIPASQNRHADYLCHEL